MMEPTNPPPPAAAAKSTFPLREAVLFAVFGLALAFPVLAGIAAAVMLSWLL